MSDGIVVFLASIFSLAFFVLCAAWLTIFPTIGLLWLAGWL